MASDPTPVAPALIEGALALADAMHVASVPYALIGGLAAGFRTIPRATRDIDFMLQVPQISLPSLLESLLQRGFEFDQIATIREWTQHHMVVLSFRGIRVDWLKPVLPLYQHVIDRATEETWLKRRIRVASAEGLILLKLLAFRSQDLVDIENLVAVYQNRLDTTWICSEWQTVASLDDPRMKKLMELLGDSDQEPRVSP